jgi:hypothetical protein
MAVDNTIIEAVFSSHHFIIFPDALIGVDPVDCSKRFPPTGESIQCGFAVITSHDLTGI